MTAAREIISRLGGYRAVAAEMPCDASRVFRWQEGGIPAHRWPRILQIAADRGVEVTLEMLVGSPPVIAEKAGA
nr:hypothetical protein [uncultured Roseococcus sp.]